MSGDFKVSFKQDLYKLKRISKQVICRTKNIFISNILFHVKIQSKLSSDCHHGNSNLKFKFMFYLTSFVTHV